MEELHKNLRVINGSQVKNTSVLPNKIYQQALQVISQVSFYCQVKYGTKEGINRILSILAEYLFLNMGRVILPSNEDDLLHIRYSHGIPKERQFVSYTKDQGITGLIYSTGQAIYADDLDTNAMYLGKIVSSDSLPYFDPAISGVPILDSNDRVIGILCVNHGFRDASELKSIFSTLESSAALISQLLTKPEGVPASNGRVLQFESNPVKSND